MAKINKTQSNKKLKLPNIKRRNNRIAVLKVHSIATRLAYQMLGLRGKDLLKTFPQYKKSTICKHCELPIESEADCVDRRRNNMGCPKKLSDRDCRLAVRKISEVRTTERSFTSRRLQVVSWLDHVSNRTFRREINDAGYNYCRPRNCDNHFPQTFMLSANPHDNLFLQDGDPSQNSAKAMQVFENMGAKVFSIPLRSPDLNPIENFFHSISVKINEESLNNIIMHETFQEFSERVKRIIVNYPTLKINKIIDNMDKRINMIIQHKGQRIKCWLKFHL